MNPPSSTAKASGTVHLSQYTTFAMAIACGIAVANIYYNQPMLGVIGQGFAGSATVGLVPTATQLGYALGLFLLVPLGDIMDRRRLIIWQFTLLGAALILAATASTAGILVAASLLVGCSATVAQHIVPFVATLATPEQRGSKIGTVMGGLLCGILLSRTLAGFVATHLGWREMFWIGMPMALGTAVWMAVILPRNQPHSGIRYGSALFSLVHLWRDEPLLRRATTMQAALFASFSTFWTILALHLEEPAFQLGADVAGMFGIIGVVGVFAAPFAGHLADRRGPQLVATSGALLTLLSWASFGLWNSVTGLIVGVILLDFGVQGAMISNQHRVFALRPEARSRINTLFMTGIFLGGTLGSGGAMIAWRFGNWSNVCVYGAALAIIAVIMAFGRTMRRLAAAFAICSAIGLVWENCDAAAAEAPTACATLSGLIDAAPSGPVFLASYPTVTEGPLHGTAFLYDNAVASIALIGCGETGKARRIGDAILAALKNDRFWHDGRLRNGYAAGAVGEGPAKLSGWWDSARQQWLEDRYQVGSDIGNMAWAMLALLAIDRAGVGPNYLEGAKLIGRWTLSSNDRHGVEGFTGGTFGHEPEPQIVTWKSTEHNTDLSAAFNRLADVTGDPIWRERADETARFVGSMWDSSCNCFAVGTGEDGVTHNPFLALDAQIWPLLAIASETPREAAVLATVERRLRVGNGFAYSQVKDAIWTEGTAQVALLYALTGHEPEAQAATEAILRQQAPVGGFYATDAPNLPTGFMLPTDPTKPRLYYRLPHLGATAWAALAERRFNPFMRSLKKRIP
jgi:predicted MFS family arabinose efflux permease